MNDLWQRLAPHVESGQEDEKVELKQQLSLEGRVERAEFARDVAALANTPGGEGYLVIGVTDGRKRQAGADPVPGFTCTDRDELRRQIGEALKMFCDPPPKVSFREVAHPPTGRTLGVVVVAQSSARPHAIKRASGEIQEDEIWVRRGPACARATRREIEEMILGRTRVIVVNLSHPITDTQLEALRLELSCTIDQVIHRPVQLDHERPLADQVREIVDAVGLPSHTWQTASIVVNLPGFPVAAAAVVAEVHGRMGHFPTVLRLRPVMIQGTTAYELAEVVNLQSVRDQSRERR